MRWIGIYEGNELTIEHGFRETGLYHLLDRPPAMEHADHQDDVQQNGGHQDPDDGECP